MSSETSRTRILEAALKLITRRGEAGVTMAEIAKAAHLSRQAVYLHFSDRADFLLALVRYVDEKRGLANELKKISDAPNGTAALREVASLQARHNPGLWAVARAVEAVRRTDDAAERSWQDRLQQRLEMCRAIISRLAEEGKLRYGLDPTEAADLLWSITSLRAWADLVLERGWTADQYVERITESLLATLTSGN